MKKWYQKSIAVVMAAACLFVGGTIGLARDSLPQLQLTAEAENKLYTGESDGLQLNYEELEDGTIEITQFVDSTSTDIELPAVIDGKSVTSIGYHAFGADDIVASRNLTSIIIPDSVTSIGYKAFLACTSLTTIAIPSSVTSIGDYAFFVCRSLTDVTIPENVTSIGSFAFSGCTSLTDVTIPDSVTSIGVGTFSRCTSLTEFIVDPDNESYSSENGALFDKNLKTIICCPGAKTGNFTIPNSVTSVENSAFSGCSSLTNIIIPDSVTSIENSAFEWCTSLTNITIPDSVTSIGNCAFWNCTGLTDIYYNGTEAEWNQISMHTSTVPSSVTVHYNSDPTTATITTTETTTLSESTTTTTTVKPNLTNIRGDVDGNNTVEVSDAVKILNYYSQKAAGLNPVFSETATENEAIFNLADVDKDGEITVQDAVLILTYYAKAASGGQPTWEQLTST